MIGYITIQCLSENFNKGDLGIMCVLLKNDVTLEKEEISNIFD